MWSHLKPGTTEVVPGFAYLLTATRRPASLRSGNSR
jgi:hypothetical protein